MLETKKTPNENRLKYVYNIPIKNQLKLITSGSIKGYTISNIKEVLGKEQYMNFKQWMYGQTVGIYKGEDLIYKDDLDRFLKGLPILD